VAGGIRASDLLAVLQDRLAQDLDAWLPDKDAVEVAADMIQFLVSCMDSLKEHDSRPCMPSTQTVLLLSASVTP
jgi:hypothetical protein